MSQNWRNALREGANVTLAVGSNPDPSIPDMRHVAKEGTKEGRLRWDPHRPEWRRGMPSKLRTTLFGHIEVYDTSIQSTEVGEISKCFLRYHPDAKAWAPGSPQSPHRAVWVKLVVDRIYAVGGFGDEHRIGWIGLEQFRKAKSSSGQLPRLREMDVTDVGHVDLFAETTQQDQDVVRFRVQAS